MWYEIIPCFTIIVLAMSAPQYLTYPMNYFVLGNIYRRSTSDTNEALHYLRDARLKDPYAVLGLENLPEDEEPKKEE